MYLPLQHIFGTVSSSPCTFSFAVAFLFGWLLLVIYTNQHKKGNLILYHNIDETKIKSKKFFFFTICCK